ncbi:MAG: LAGLIDADG family homing endonuclease, partial [bacterium]
MKIFVLGSKGMLGRYVSTYFKSEGYDVVDITRKELDIIHLREEEIRAKLFFLGLRKGDVVINCIGMIKQRSDANDIDFIYINSIFPHLLANVCENKGCKMVHPTTDCFLPNTKILSIDGYKNIEDIDINDYVYTHNNNIKKVIDIMSKPVDEEIYHIKTLGNDLIKCTENHPWYVIKRKSKESFNFEDKKWVKTSELEKGNLILIPKIKLNNQTIFNINLLNYSEKHKKIYDEYDYFLNNIKNSNMNIKKYCNEHKLNYKKITKWKNNENIKPKIYKLINNLDINEDIMWFFGIFLAEGWINNKVGRKNITISFGNEKYLIDKTFNIIIKYFNIIPSIRKMKNQKGYQISFTHPILSEMLSIDFYTKTKHYSHNKKIPVWINDIGKDNILSFIKGYLDGDGCFYDKNNGIVLSVSSTSEKLIDDLKLLLLKVGFLSNKTSSNHSKIILNRIVNFKKAFSLSISGNQIDKLLNLLKINSVHFDNKKRYNKFFEDDYYWYVPITKIYKENYKGMVFNLEVEDDHSYLVNGGLSAHNCVFDGLLGRYTEESLHNATDVYGKSKSLGEPKNATVIRTSIIGEEIGQNRSLVEWIKSNKDKEVRGYMNHFWNGVTCLQFAKICKNIIDNNNYWNGVKHVYSNTVSKFDLVNMVSKIYELNIKIKEYNTTIKCDRSLSSVYNNTFNNPDLYKQIEEMKEF